MRSKRDNVGRLFARLTGELEDACELAVEGQNPRLHSTRHAALTRRLRHRLGRAEATIDGIDGAIARLWEVDK